MHKFMYRHSIQLHICVHLLQASWLLTHYIKSSFLVNQCVFQFFYAAVTPDPLTLCERQTQWEPGDGSSGHVGHVGDTTAQGWPKTVYPKLLSVLAWTFAQWGTMVWGRYEWASTRSVCNCSWAIHGAVTMVTTSDPWPICYRSTSLGLTT